MNFKTSIIIAAALLASPAAVQAKAAAPAARSFACEGVAAWKNSSAFTGTMNSDSRFSFQAKVKPSTSEAILYSVGGLTLLKPGRVLLTPSKTGIAFTVDWTDPTNLARRMDINIDGDGVLTGISDTANVSTPGADMVCQIFGMCDMVKITNRVELSGICAETK